MRVIAWLRRKPAEVAGGVFAALAIAAIISDLEWAEAAVIPLVLTIFAGLVWHGRRRQAVLDEVQGLAEMRASLLERQERFLHDASHELRTPITIARGHLELLRRERPEAPELEVALDELGRMEGIVERLLLLAKSEQQGLALQKIDLEAFLSDLFIRWSEVAQRAWRLDVDLEGRLLADPEALRDALDALLENAVKYTDAGDTVELAAYPDGVGGVVIKVSDSGLGVPLDALPHIFDRWARADGARTRERGGAGLGLAIVVAVARAHGGHCSVEPLPHGTAFRLHLPVRPAAESAPSPTLADEALAPATPGVHAGLPSSERGRGGGAQLRKPGPALDRHVLEGEEATLVRHELEPG
jgi:signal transduction histidine kinase